MIAQVERLRLTAKESIDDVFFRSIITQCGQPVLIGNLKRTIIQFDQVACQMLPTHNIIAFQDCNCVYVGETFRGCKTNSNGTNKHIVYTCYQRQ